jgi:cytochrome c oxidase subunit 2
MLAERDELAIQLLNDFKRVAMPNSNLDEAEVESVIAYIKSTSDAVGSDAGPGLPPSAEIDDRSFGGVQTVALAVFVFMTAIILGVFGFVAESTTEPKVVDVKSAYKLRKVFFISGLAVLGSLLVITLPSNPYDLSAETADEIVYTTARQFSFSYSREPVTSVEELGQIPTSPVLEVAPETLVEFRVTSLDATHGFAVYNPDGAIIAQTQAMPGYINRLRVRFGEAGRYPVLCLEFCGTAHHLMRSSIVVVDGDQPDQQTERD